MRLLLETGYYYPSRIVNDHLFDKGPKNSGNKYYGEVSVREALTGALNTVAWQVLADIGVDYGTSYLDKMHFVGLSYLDNWNTSMSIGGFTEGARRGHGKGVLRSGQWRHVQQQYVSPALTVSTKGDPLSGKPAGGTYFYGRHGIYGNRCPKRYFKPAIRYRLRSGTLDTGSREDGNDQQQ